MPVRSEKVRVSLVRLQQVEGELVTGGDKMEVYERLLMECQDALQVTREELSSEQVSRVVNQLSFSWGLNLSRHVSLAGYSNLCPLKAWIYPEYLYSSKFFRGCKFSWNGSRGPQKKFSRL